MTWITKRALRAQLAQQLEINGQMWRAWAAAHRELDKLDGHSDRHNMAPADRIALYLNEQRMQLKADELGKPVVFVCNRRCLNAYGPVDVGLDIILEAPTFHQHTVHPRPAGLPNVTEALQ